MGLEALRRIRVEGSEGFVHVIFGSGGASGPGTRIFFSELEALLEFLEFDLKIEVIFTWSPIYTT